MRTGSITSATLALLAALLVSTGAVSDAGAAGPAPAVTIDAVSPTRAERGGLATISGNGFGGPNVRITVDGARADVVGATGNRATFRVPALAGPGRVLVRATNPGGRAGQIEQSVHFDGTALARVDEARATGEPIGEAGGAISVAGMTLEIPAGAVPEGETITLTPLSSVVGSPFAAAPVGVKMEPSGLVLLKPATLTFPRPAGAGQVVAFGFDGSGQSFHLIPYTADAHNVSVRVWHFSGAGAVSVSAGELNEAFGYEPTPAHELAEQRIAAALAQALPPDEQEALIFAALRDWYQSSVRTGLQVASSGELAFFELAFGEWQAWLGTAALYSTSSWTQQQNEAFSLAVSAGAQHARTLLPRCTAGGTPLTALRNVIRLAAVVNIVDLPIEQQLDADGHALPSGPNLPGACLHVEISALAHASILARNRDNQVTADAAVHFYDGTSSNAVPLRFRLEDVTDGAPLPVGSATVTNGHWQTSVRPTTLGQRVYDLTAELSGAATDPVLRAFSAQRNVAVPVRDRLELHARRAADATFADTIGSVAPGGTVFLRIRLAGDNIAGIPIDLTHDGAGGLPASATTNSSGEVIVTYTAPGTPQIELVNATVTDNGFATGDAVVITTREPIVVTVTPSFGFVSGGQTLQFSATVTGTANTAVVWNATGGSIDGNGLYTAGNTDGGFAVTATSVADSSEKATAFVQITTADVSGLYSGTRCIRSEGETISCGGAWLRYSCSRQSVVGNGTVCGWSTTFNPEIGFPRINVPVLVRFCEVETTGARGGGSFTGKITFCQPPPLSFVDASFYSGVSISGSIGGGRLTMTVDGAGAGTEVYDLARVD
jgi:hypothetical protein